jgi:hypothetical protein
MVYVRRNLVVKVTHAYGSMTEEGQMYEDKFGYLEQLPEAIRGVFMMLCQDVARLKQKWDFYLGLFGKQEDHVLFELAPLAFLQIEESVRNDLVMSICRLGDPAQSRVKGGVEDNLTFAYLAEFYQADAILEELVKKYRDEDTELFRTHRNKFVGHSDLNARLNSSHYPVQALAKPDMDRAFESATKILKHVAGQYVDKGPSKNYVQLYSGACPDYAAGPKAKLEAVLGWPLRTYGSATPLRSAPEP